MEEEVKQDSLEEVKHKLLEIMKFGLSSCVKADKIGLSIQTHFNDAQEYLTQLKKLTSIYIKIQKEDNENNINPNEEISLVNLRIIKMFRYDNEFTTAILGFKEINKKFSIENRDEEYSIVKKIIKTYNFKNITPVIMYLIEGLLERYLS